MSVFSPTIFKAKCCGSLVISSYPGEFCKCTCGNSFVDETAWLRRAGGQLEPVIRPFDYSCIYLHRENDNMMQVAIYENTAYYCISDSSNNTRYGKIHTYPLTEVLVDGGYELIGMV